MLVVSFLYRLPQLFDAFWTSDTIGICMIMHGNDTFSPHTPAKAGCLGGAEGEAGSDDRNPKRVEGMALETGHEKHL